MKKSFIMQRLSIVVLGFMLFSPVTMASTDGSWCYITTAVNNDHKQQLQLADQVLLCNKKSAFNNLPKSTTIYPKNQLLMVRGNVFEIQHLPVIVLLQAHGYHLVLKQQLDELQHDDHLNYIEIDDFKPIIKSKLTIPKESDPTILALVNQVSTAAWLTDIVTLSTWSRRTGEPGNVSAASWIENKFSALNLQVSQTAFNVGSTNTNNIMAIQPGLTLADEWYVVGAHMDSTANNGSNAPGAVDNASGCAAVLEMARIASQYDFASSLIFMCYSGEEQGLYGSEFHADSLISSGDVDKVKAVLTLDMVGYIHNNNHELLVESSSSYQWLMDTMVQNAAIYTPDLLVFTTTNYFGSDHVSYINNGMPGVLSIDNDYGLYADYHRTTDLPENINTNQGEYIIKTNLATLAQLAGLLGSVDLIYRNGFE